LLTERIRVLVLNAHGVCNCRCAMCDIWKRKTVDEIGAAEFNRQLNDIEKLGVEWVVFSGGEPLLHADLFRKSRELRARGIRTTVLSSGLLIERYAAEIAQHFTDLIVSLDGPRRIHDRIRGVAKAFDLIEAGIRRVRSFDPRFPVSARCTVQRTNCRLLVETVNAARLLDVDSISFLAVDTHSEAFNRTPESLRVIDNDVSLTLDDVHALESQIETLIARGESGSFVRESPEKLRRLTGHFRAALGLSEFAAPVCNAPWTSAVVEADGSVRPCFFHAPFGKMGAGAGLFEILNGPEAHAFREHLDVATNPTCKRCVCSRNGKSEVPATDDAGLVLVAENGHARGGEREQSGIFRRQSHPSGREDAQYMSMSE
jgi:radical SAM protein with 4Fe4S-binding SPASM domain